MWIDVTDLSVYENQYQVRAARPNVSFPEPVTDQAFLDHGFAPVIRTDPPSYDPITQNLSQLTPRQTENGWIQQWEVTLASVEEIAQRLEKKRAGMVVSKFQGKAALLAAGILPDVEALVADPAADPLVVLAWQDVTEFRRLSPMIAGIAAALGWTDEQLDSLFESAALISA